MDIIIVIVAVLVLTAMIIVSFVIVIIIFRINTCKQTIRAKTNISPPKEGRISLNKDQIDKIYKHAQKIISLHHYKN